MLLAILIFTMMDALAKSLIRNYGTVQVIWARYTGQTVVVALIVARHLPATLRARYPGLQLLRSLCQFGASALFFTSLSYIGLAEATAISDLSPVLITLGAVLFLGERIGPRRAFAVAAALVGALIIIRPGAAVFVPAALLPLAGAVCYATYALVTRHVGAAESVWTSLLYAAMFGTIVTSVALPWYLTTPALADLPGFLLIGLLGAAAQLCVIRSFTLAEASVVAPITYIGIVLATLWGWLFFGEWPDVWTGVGALVIVGAGLYVWHRERRLAQRPERLEPPATG